MIEERSKKPKALDCDNPLPLFRGSLLPCSVSWLSKTEPLPRGRSLGALIHVHRPARQQAGLQKRQQSKEALP